MKRLHTLLTMVAIAALSFTFTSCDDDEYIADTLWGTWEGNIYVTHEWSGRYYDASRSFIYFDRTSSRSGRGYWIDYYDDAPWGTDRIYSHISWTVNNGDINIYFEEDHYPITIYNYSLNDRYFEGYIDTRDRDRVHFQLRKTSEPIRGGYNYWDDYYYYGKQNGFVEETRAASNNIERPKRLFRLRE